MTNKAMERIMELEYYPTPAKYKIGYSKPNGLLALNPDGTPFEIDGKPLMGVVPNRRGSYQGRGKVTTL
jgi:hypothetical protein